MGHGSAKAMSQSAISDLSSSAFSARLPPRLCVKLFVRTVPPMPPHDHLSFDRRRFLAAGLGLSWLTPVGTALAREADRSREPAKSVILLWLGGGPSQLETFDPHPDTK